MSDFMHKGTRYRKEFKIEQDAESYEKDFKKHLSEGWPIDKFLIHKKKKEDNRKDINVKDMFDLVLERKWKGMANYENAFSHAKMFCNHFGPKTLVKDIKTIHIDDFVEACKKADNAPATIKLKLATLSKAINYCVKREYLTARPPFPKITVKNERMVFFSRQEEQEILNFLKETGEHYFYDFFCWQMDTGCRPSESRCVKHEHIRIDDQFGFVVDLFKTKNGEPRTVPLTKRAKAAFKNHRNKEYIWGYWTKERIRSVWDKVRAHLGKTGDKNFVFYLTRHTCGSRIVQATGSIYLVKDMLGHKTLEQSMRYAKLSPNNLRQAVKALDNNLPL